MAGHTTNNLRNVGSAQSDMLDLSFLTEWSDDEGIGSDVSLENSASDQSSSNGTLNNTNSDTLQRQNKLVKIPKRNISVKKFVKILRRSVGSSETVSTEVVPDAAVPECQFQSQKVFGVDLTEHLEQTSCLVPRIVEFCCDIIQENGLTDGVYRLSGQSSHIVTLKREFEGGKVPEHHRDITPSSKTDVHAVASLLKLYFRSLPEPLLTFNLYQDFIQAAKFSLRYQVSSLRKLCGRLPKTHQNTLVHLIKHLQKLSTYHEVTGMTSRNLAIVWAPNLLRPTPNTEDCLRDCGLQALVIEAMIVYYEEIFEAESDYSVCVTRKNFTKEVSIDQAVARAESFKPPPVTERRMTRSISCVSNMKMTGLESDRSRPSLFQSRGVHLKRDRSLNCENVTRHRQLPVPEARLKRQEKCIDYQSSNYGSARLQQTDPEVAVSDINDASDMPDDDDGEANDVTEQQKMNKLRTSRSRLKERLNWFSSRSRQRLSSFGSSDNLKHVRDGFLRSRDKLSCALSPVRGRMGSYQFVDNSDLDNFPSQGSICVRVGTWQ